LSSSSSNTFSRGDFTQATTIQVIASADRIRQQYLNLIRSSTEDILLVFPSINAVHREHSIGVLDELQNAVKRGVKIRILSAEDDFIKHRLDSLRASGIIVRRIETPTEAKFKMLIIDRRSVFLVETKDDSRALFNEAVGTALFSNSKATVLPFVTIFESFWRETDLYEKAREADRVKDEFVHIAAHELRNPVMPIISGAELVSDILLQAKEDIDPKIFDELMFNIKLLERNSKKLLRLSEDILQVSRIESGNFILNIGHTDIAEIIESVVADVEVRYEAERPDVKIVIDSKIGNHFIVNCDGSKISQTISNLLDNAMKFTKEGNVVITAVVEGEEILISIKDSGTGIHQDIRDRLFEKFVSKSNSGTGLGLYLSKKIVEAHGGRIWFEENPDGKGTCFTFSIPDIQVAGQPAPRARMTTGATTTTMPKSDNKNILKMKE
jgi:signal transduction histidine kinase